MGLYHKISFFSFDGQPQFDDKTKIPGDQGDITGPAHYINSVSKQGDKLSVTNNFSGGEYGKHEIAASDGVFLKH